MAIQIDTSAIHSDTVGGPGLGAREPATRRCDRDSRLRPSGLAIRKQLAAVDGPVVLFGPACATAELGAEGEVVVCLDGSARSASVLATATSMAERLGRRLCLVAVLTPSDAARAAASGCDAERVLGHQLAGAADDLDAAGFEVEWDVLHGTSVADAVLAHVETHDVALIAANSHASGTSDSAAADATWVTVVRRASVPVLLTRVTTTSRPPARPPTGPPPRRRRPPTPAAAQHGGRVPALAARAAERSEPPRRRASLRAHWPAAVVLALVLVVLVTVPTPYISQHGAVRPVKASLDDGVDRSDGRLLYPVVVTDRENVLGAVQGWLDPDVDIRPRATLTETAWARSVEQMEVAKRSAATAARRAVWSRAPTVADRARAAPAIHIDSGSTLGPSAGLAYALAVFDLMSPGDLTAGRTVVATGEIHPDGRVAAVRGVRIKTAAVRATGADLFIVPCPNLAEATSAAGLMAVTCANTLEDAIEAVEAMSGARG